MKGKYIATFAVFAFIVFFFSIEAKADDWAFYSTSTAGDSYYYDPQSVKRVSEDIVQVLIKNVYGEKSLEKMIKRHGVNNEPSYSVSLSECNCKEKKLRILSHSDYSEDGTVIYSSSPSEDSSSWNFVYPFALNDALFNIVCGGR